MKLELRDGHLMSDMPRMTKDIGNSLPDNWSSPYSIGFTGDWLGAWGIGFSINEAGKPITPIAALQSAALMACVKALSEDLSKLPLKLLKKLPKNRLGLSGGFEEVENHPLVDLLAEPNDWQTPFEFWTGMIQSLLLWGNGYAYIKRGRDGTPKGLIFLHPARVSIIYPVNSPRFYYRITHTMLFKGQSKDLAPEDILHVKGMSLDGGFKGKSVIELNQTVIGLDIATRNHAAKTFKQGTNLSGLLKSEKILSQEGMAKMRDSWERAFGGNENAMRVAVLQENTSYEPLGMTNADAQLIEARKQNIEEVTRLFRVPLHKIGVLDHATFSNIEDQNQSYIDDALMSHAVIIEQALNKKLLREDQKKKFEFKFDFDTMLRGNSLVRAQRNQLRKSNGVITANEWRADDGMQPVDDPEADELKVNQNLAGKPNESTNLPKDEQ